MQVLFGVVQRNVSKRVQLLVVPVVRWQRPCCCCSFCCSSFWGLIPITWCCFNMQHNHAKMLCVSFFQMVSKLSSQPKHAHRARWRRRSPVTTGRWDYCGKLNAKRDDTQKTWMLIKAGVKQKERQKRMFSVRENNDGMIWKLWIVCKRSYKTKLWRHLV